MKPGQYDIVIAGGGVTGCALAYFLASNKDFQGRIALVEPDPSYQRAATPKSAGGVRQQFSTPANIAMSKFAVEFIARAPELLEVDGQSPDLGFRQQGYLFMATDGRKLSDLYQTQIGHGAKVRLLDKAALKIAFPWLNIEDIEAGSFGPEDGWLDPYQLLQAFRRKAKALGVEFLQDEVAGLEVKDYRVKLVHLQKSGKIETDILVNQTGARARDIAAFAAIDLPVFPRKRNVFVFSCRTDLPAMPLCIDTSGVWWRPESGQYICGLSPAPEKDPDTWDEEIDENFFMEEIWPILAHRVPAFEAIKRNHAWAGQYDYNSFDQNVLIGPASQCKNFYFANGFSGHGLQQAPAIGRGLSELILYGSYRSLDLSALSYSRYLANNPIVERHVV